MQLGLLMAVVAAITISENAPHEPVESAFTCLLLTFLSASGVVLFAAVGSHTISRGLLRNLNDAPTWHDRFSRIKRVHITLWLSATLISLDVLNWPRLVRFNWGFDRALLVKDLLVMAPIWAPLLLSWAAFYDVEKTALQISQPTRPTANAPNRNRRLRFVWLHARHYLGLGFLPVLALLVFQDLATVLVPDWQHSDFSCLLFLVPLVAVTLVFPQLLSRIWHTTPVPCGPLRNRLVALAGTMQVGCRDFRIWRTDGQMLNAAVAGLFASVRLVFLTDALLGCLEDDEIEAVVVHELGHIQRRHVLLRMLMLFLPLWLLACSQMLLPTATNQISQWVSNALAGYPLRCLLLPAASLLLAAIALSWYSRLLEHDADLCLLRAGRAATFVAAIKRLAQLSGDRPQRATWLHPSIEQRVDLLQHAMQAPEAATRFRRRVHQINAILILAWVLGPVVLLCVLVVLLWVLGVSYV